MENNGYILLAKKSLNSDIWYKPPLYWKIWSYILFRANYKDNGNIKKGEFITTINELQDVGTYYIGYRKVRPTEKQIRTILDYLRKPYEAVNESQMIVITKVIHAIKISVVNYGFYQASENYEGNTKVLRTDNEGQSKGAIIKKNIKNKEIKNIFIKPTIDEIRQYVLEKGLNVDVDMFFNYYDSNDWKDSKNNQVKNWKQKAITWNKKNPSPRQNLSMPTYDPSKNNYVPEDELNSLLALRGNNELI